MSDKNLSGVRVPPPIIVLVFLVLAFAADWRWPLAFLPLTLQLVLGFLLMAPAVALAVWAALTFHRCRTPLDHFQETTALVTSGPFALSRNPIYLAMALFLAGLALAVDSLWIAVFMVPTLLLLDRYVIAREEAYMERKFGAAFSAYRAQVRRWI